MIARVSTGSFPVDAYVPYKKTCSNSCIYVYITCTEVRTTKRVVN